jgi:hypothetical protein
MSRKRGPVARAAIKRIAQDRRIPMGAAAHAYDCMSIKRKQKMTELTLHEKTREAQRRAREEVLEQHYFDQAQPFFPLGFSIGYRNPGHWDVIAREPPGRITAMLEASPGSSTSARDGDRVRVFRIRGGPGQVYVYDERWNPHKKIKPDLEFKSVMGAMLWICEELMQEPQEVT